MTTLSAGKVDFSGGWSSLWGAISGQLGGVLTILTWVGVIMVVFSVMGWVYQKRKGGGMGQGASGVFITLFVGAVLCAPQLLIPAVLGILDFVANSLLSLIQRAS